MTVSYSGIAGKRGKNPTKIVIHNDGGSRNATASFYKSWLESHNPELGFAHEYIASDGSYQAEKAENSAWHCANAVGNRDYYGIEVCQSLGDEGTFKANEQKAFKRAAQLCKQWGLNPSTSIFPLHRELSSTDCPHRSFALHGKANTAVKQYYVDQVKKYMGNTTPSNPTPAPATKTVKVLPHATNYSKASNKAKIADFVKNKYWTVVQERALNPNEVYSNKEYLVGRSAKDVFGWVLSQDVEGGYGSDKVGKPSTPAKKPDQILSKGSKVKVNGVFQVYSVDAKYDAVASTRLAGGTPTGLNYIDAKPLTKTDKNGKKTPNQVFKKGDYFIVSGEFTVSKVDAPSNGALIRFGRYDTWVDAAVLTETKEGQ